MKTTGRQSRSHLSAWWAAPLLAATLPACAPVFSEFQGARLVGKGRVEVTPSVSRVNLSADGDSGHVQDQVGIQLGVGLHEAVELRGRYEHVDAAGDIPSVEIVGVGPKLRLIENRLALFVPVGRGFGGADFDLGDSWAVHPTLLFTMPASQMVEVNASAKLLVPLKADGGDNLVAFNLGMGLGPDLDRWAIRPEVGVLLNPGEDGRFYHFGLGVSFRPR